MRSSRIAAVVVAGIASTGVAVVGVNYGSDKEPDLLAEAPDKAAPREEGEESHGASRSPVPPPTNLPPLSSVTAISATYEATCALLQDGKIACWGQLGPPECEKGLPFLCTPATRPIMLPGSERMREISLHTWPRAITMDGRLMQWGPGLYPYFKQDLTKRNLWGPKIDTPAPSYGDFAAMHPDRASARMSSPPNTDIMLVDSLQPLATGLKNVRHLDCCGCHETFDGATICDWPWTWGWIRRGPFGLEGRNFAMALESRGGPTCEIDGGELHCENRFYSEKVAPPTPERYVIPMPAPVDRMGVIGSPFDCAILVDGSVACWSPYESGTLGSPPTSFDVRPDLHPVAIAEYGSYVCTANADGVVQCWPPSPHKKNISDLPMLQVTTVEGLGRVVELAGGSYHICALAADGTVRCWGGNEHGQLGTGRTGGEDWDYLVSEATRPGMVHPVVAPL